MSGDQSILRITLVQQPLVWEDTVANLIHFSEELQGLAGETDVVILPEMFTTGFTMDVKNNHSKMDGLEIAWMQTKAKETKSLIIGSIIIEENHHYYNRLIVAKPNGEILYYDKRHLFRMANEHEH